MCALHVDISLTGCIESYGAPFVSKLVKLCYLHLTKLSKHLDWMDLHLSLYCLASGLNLKLRHCSIYLFLLQTFLGASFASRVHCHNIISNVVKLKF